MGSEVLKTRRMKDTRSDYEAFRRRVNQSPVYNFLKMKIVEMGRGFSRVEIEVRDDLKNAIGSIHGGIVATLIDSACGVAVHTCFEDGVSLVTLDLKITYFLPSEKGILKAEGAVLHVGKNIGVAEAGVIDSEGHLVAKGMSTHFLRMK